MLKQKSCRNPASLFGRTRMGTRTIKAENEEKQILPTRVVIECWRAA